jgi:hypothetical protein
MCVMITNTQWFTEKVPWSIFMKFETVIRYDYPIWCLVRCPNPNLSEH